MYWKVIWIKLSTKKKAAIRTDKGRVAGLPGRFRWTQLDVKSLEFLFSDSWVLEGATAVFGQAPERLQSVTDLEKHHELREAGFLICTAVNRISSQLCLWVNVITYMAGYTIHLGEMEVRGPSKYHLEEEHNRRWVGSQLSPEMPMEYTRRLSTASSDRDQYMLTTKSFQKRKKDTWTFYPILKPVHLLTNLLI